MRIIFQDNHGKIIAIVNGTEYMACLNDGITMVDDDGARTRWEVEAIDTHLVLKNGRTMEATVVEIVAHVYDTRDEEYMSMRED